MTMTSQFNNMTSSSTFFDVAVSYFLKFSCLSNFRVNIITGSRVMKLFGLKIRNRKYPISFPISRDWSKLGIPNLANNPAECQGYSFDRF